MKKVTKLILIFLVVLIFSIGGIIKNFYPLKYSDSIYKYSEKYELDPYFVAAVIKTESNFDPNAISKKNAYGLMQITGETGEWAAEQMEIKDFTIDKLLEPDFNIAMGCWYLNNLNTQFKGNKDLVLAAYNAGSGNVQKWLNSSEHSKDGKNLHYIPFKETDKYLKKVRVNHNIYKFLYSKSE